MAAHSLHGEIKVGDRFGRWTVVGPTRSISTSGKPRRMAPCVCECGVQKDVLCAALRGSASKSCGCLNRDVSRAKVSHGAARKGRHTAEYRTWSGMNARCYRASHPRYKDYGARGITVCSDWKNSFQSFLSDMGPKPGPEYSIDRIDNSRGYEPTNCRWATPRDQMSNRRVSVSIEYFGAETPVSLIPRPAYLSLAALHARLRMGWAIERALSEPLQAKSKRGSSTFR